MTLKTFRILTQEMPDETEISVNGKSEISYQEGMKTIDFWIVEEKKQEMLSKKRAKKDIEDQSEIDAFTNGEVLEI